MKRFSVKNFERDMIIGFAARRFVRTLLVFCRAVIRVVWAILAEGLGPPPEVHRSNKFSFPNSL